MSGYNRRESCGRRPRASYECDEYDNFSGQGNWREDNWDDYEPRNSGCNYANFFTDQQNIIDQLQREAEEELQQALKVIRATERVIPQRRSRGSSSRYRREEPTCDEDLTYSESEIPRRSFNRESDCPPKKPTKSCMKSRSKKDENGIEKDLPRKPKLTKEQLKRLLEDEKKDVDLALSLASDAEEVYKKPCPKQQKAKQSIKELVGTKMATKENLSKIIQLRELMELEPEDMTPDMIATIIFSEEKGILLDSSPDHTVQHLFPDKSRKKSSSANKDELGFIYQDDPAEEAENIDEVKSQEKRTSFEGSSEFYVDAPEEVLSQNEEPRYFNKVQLRGSTPQWFPGYMAIFPDGGENIHFARSPSEVFQKAWLSSTPTEFHPNDVFIIQ